MSPKFHDHDVGVPVDVSVKFTVKGAVPENGAPVNPAVRVFENKLYNATPFGDPHPVHGSHPVVAVYAPLLPTKTSRHNEIFEYTLGCNKPICLEIPWFILAVNPDHNGDTALVPPTIIYPF